MARSTATTLAKLGPHARLRRWDQKGDAATAEGITITNNWMPLEDGLEVRFSGDYFKSGDYWLIPARTATKYEQGHIEWPYDDLTNTPLAQLPLGIHHAYCPLALVGFEAPMFKSSHLSDCRKIFPPLIEVTEGAEPGQLCCNFTVGNGKESYGDYNDLQEAINNLPSSGGQICLLPGEHAGNFEIIERKHIIISGCKWRTSVIPSPKQSTGPTSVSRL